jgi:diaminopimelate decarboxylase
MPRLTPILHAEGDQFLADKWRIENLVTAFGSPLNVLFPERVVENSIRFSDAARQAGVTCETYFPLKPNKAASTVARASLTDVGADVASAEELVHALSQGIPAQRTEATGPKNARFLRLCIQHGVRIHLDSGGELKRVLRIRKQCNAKEATAVFLRVNGLGSSGSLSADSRFGTKASEIEEVLAALSDKKEEIRFLGFAFHLNTANTGEKVRAIDEALQLTLRAGQIGLSPTHLNIGGGFKINFLKSEAEWNAYLSAVKNGAMANGKTMGWNESSLGYGSVDGRLTGKPEFHPHFVKTAGVEEFASLLEQQLPSFENAQIKTVLNDLLLTIVIEPGRSLLDQAGMTLARVIEVKRSVKNEMVIVLEMNRSNMNASDIEFMSDPIVIQSGSSHNNTKEGFGGFIAGNLCLHGDFIMRRRVELEITPEPGDILAFVNTAGYNMDFAESATVRQPMARKVAVTRRGDSFHCVLDEEYDPLSIPPYAV